MANIHLHNCNCLDFMKGLPDKAYDLAIVDPPYGIDINMNMGRRAGQKKAHVDKSWDSEPPDARYFKELFRVSKDQIIWGGNYFPLPLTKSWIFWDKGVPSGVDFADGELAWTSFDKTLIKAKIKYSGFQGMDIGGKIHPTQKPVSLYKWVLKNFGNRGGAVIDTHGGSGSILIACYDLGFDIDWMELDIDYFNAAQDRLDKHIAKYAPASEIPVTKNGEIKLF